MSQIDCRPVVVGTRVWCALPYLGAGIVYAVHGEAAPETVAFVFDKAGVKGGAAKYDIVFENGAVSHHLSEAILRGTQWRIYDTVATADEIAAALAASAITRARAEANEAAGKAAFAAEVARLQADQAFGHLEQGDDRYSGKLAAKNIRAELRRAFKGVKFSVRMAHYGSISIAWEDGPTASAVEGVANKYQAGSFNGMEDIYEYSASAWNEVFGGAKYINTGRAYSPAMVTKAIDQVFRENDDALEGVPVPTVAEYESGQTWNVWPGQLGDNLQRMIGRVLQDLAG